MRHLVAQDNNLALSSLDNFFQLKNKFDFLTCIDTLDNLNNPLEMMKRIYEEDERDAVIFILMPNFDSCFSRINLGIHPYYAYPQHLNYNILYSLKYLVEAAGFHTVKVTTKLCFGKWSTPHARILKKFLITRDVAYGINYLMKLAVTEFS